MAFQCIKHFPIYSSLVLSPMLTQEHWGWAGGTHLLRVPSLSQGRGWLEPRLYSEPPLCKTRLVRVWCGGKARSLPIGSRTQYPKIWHHGSVNILNWRSLRKWQKWGHSDSPPHLSVLKAGDTSPTWQVPCLYQKEGRHPYHRWQEI